jgi:branched-chain amino acid transport system substrate-binding protein
VSGIGLARGRALAACAICGLAAAVSGCTAANSTVSVSGTKLTIYASAPATASTDSRAQDVLAAERLAFQQASKSIGGFTVRFVVLNGAKPSDNARSAIEDKTAIAYLGEVVPGQSAASLGILNFSDVLTVSPTDTAQELTQATSAVPGSPNNYYEQLSTYGRTFARLVPTTALEAKALLNQAQTLGVSRVFVARDGEPYGAALAAALKADATGAVSVSVGPATQSAFSSSGARAIVYAGTDPLAAARLFNSVILASPTAKLLAPSALDTQSFVANLPPTAARSLYVSAPGLMPSQLPGAFTSAFRGATGHAPSPEAIFGYEAMQAVLAVLREAGAKANDRAIVVKDFFAIRNRQSALGAYSIDANGDTSLAPFVISRVSAAGALLPYRSAQG